MKKLLESLNMTCSEFSKEYEIPYNTVLQWKNGIRQAPKYLITLIERLNEEKKQKNTLKTYYKGYVRYKGDTLPFDLHSKDFKTYEDSKKWQDHIKNMKDQLKLAYLIKIEENAIEKIEIL